MILARNGLGCCITNSGDRLDGDSAFFNTETAAGQDFFVATSMEIGEPSVSYTHLTLPTNREV